MANIKFTGFWSKSWQKQIPKGFILIKPKNQYIKRLAVILNKLNQFQDKKRELRELDITIEFHYKKRTLDQNALLWSLYEIEANEMNAGMSGDKKQMVTKDELYADDLKIYAPRIEIKATAENLSFLKSQYRIESERPIVDESGNIKYYFITAIISTSHFTTLQMAGWIDRMFNRMAVNGVNCTNPKEIYDYWVKWSQMKSDEKIILHDDILSGAEYKALNPICEATGNFIGDDSGQLCHIKARGMGGNPEEEKDYSSNWLHLCHEAHISVQHSIGWTYFLKLYPHLKYKVEMALKREYPAIEESKELYQNNIAENNKNNIKQVFGGNMV